MADIQPFSVSFQGGKHKCIFTFTPDGKLEFQGDATEAAKLFLEHLSIEFKARMNKPRIETKIVVKREGPGFRILSSTEKKYT